MRNGTRLFAIVTGIGMTALGLLGSGLTGTARAANIPYSVSITPFAGGYLFEGNQHLQDKPAYGLALGLNLSEHWAVEAVYRAVPDTHTTSGARTRVTVQSVSGDILYHFLPEQRFVPYLAVGGGVMYLDPQGKAADGDAMAEYGAGFKYFLTDNFALRADVRHIFDITVNDKPRPSDYYNHVAYTGGFTFQFGGASPASRGAAAQEPVPVTELPPPQPTIAHPAPPPVPVREEAVVPPQPEKVAAIPEPPAPEPAVAAAVTAPVAGAPVITGVTVVVNGLEIVAKGGVGRYKVFNLARPSRLVIDIYGAANGLPWKMLPVNAHGIAVARVGTHPDHLRIVLDAAGDKLISSRVVRTDNGLKVELTR